MTQTQALIVKFLRIRLECTWGKLSAHYYNRYELGLPFTNDEHWVRSYIGRYLCRQAQELLNENWEDEC